MLKKETIQVDNYSPAEANWSALGTEYESSSFYALKEFLDNSFSACVKDRFCNVEITLTEVDDEYILVEIEDNASGIMDPNVLLSIGSLSKDKNGLHNQYGYGSKNALAFFQPEWSNSDWIIQSKTETDLHNMQFLHVEAPYYYPHEKNIHHHCDGIFAAKVGMDEYQGKHKNTSGTYIRFTTKKKIFSKINPLNPMGAPIKILQTSAEKLSELVSQFYQPKIKSAQVRVEIFYRSLHQEEYSKIVVTNQEYPSEETFEVKKFSYISPSGGKVQVSAKWFAVNRYQTNFFVPPTKNGMVCYVNGIMTEPFIWKPEIFGTKWNGEVDSVLCVVEVEANKLDAPEVSVSKTKFIHQGKNFTMLMDQLASHCPASKIKSYSKRNAVTSEKGKITQFVDNVINNPLYDRPAPETEVAIIINSKLLSGNECRYDLVDITHEKQQVKIMEFKKGEIKPAAVYQANTYYDLALLQYEGYQVEMIVIGETINTNAKTIIDTLSFNSKKNIKFCSFADLGLPK